MSNIEIRTMGEENKPDAVKGVELEKQEIGGIHLLIKEMDPVTMTEMNMNQDQKVDKLDSQSSFDSDSLIGSFLLIESGQSNEEEEKESDSAISGKVKILKFEDTLTPEDSKQFKIIYDSLLLEGKAGNLTKSTLEVVLAQKPPTWLQVIHERLKHLMINSETILKGKKRGTNENNSLGTVNILIP